MADAYALNAHPDYGFLQVAPTPSPAEIERFYASEFYSEHYGKLNDSGIDAQTRDKEWYDANRASVARTLERLFGGPLAGRAVLDVGCGWCESLRFFQALGMRCYGFDPSPEAVEHGRKQGLDVRVAGVERMDAFGERRFDVVTLTNVLEHLADPVKAVQELRDLLTPDGLLVIDVPNEFNAFQVAGREVHGLDEWWVSPPAHLNYFSGTTLRALLEGEGLVVRAQRSSFPLELFLLFGDDYVSDAALGRAIHERRMAFEANMLATGHEADLDRFYEHLAKIDLGRQIVTFAGLPPG